MGKGVAAAAIDVVDLDDLDDLDRRWLAAGRRLREVEPLEYARIRELALAFARLHDEPLEPREQYDATCAFIARRSGGAS